MVDHKVSKTAESELLLGQVAESGVVELVSNRKILPTMMIFSTREDNFSLKRG